MLRRISSVEGRTSRGMLRYLKELRELAREHRRLATKSEQTMWNLVRDRKMGYKFTRQKPIDRFVIDFYCSELLLAVEIDGGYHKSRKYHDTERDKRLGWRNIVVVRYLAQDVLNKTKIIKEDLKEKIEERVKALSDVPLCQERE